MSESPGHSPPAPNPPRRRRRIWLRVLLVLGILTCVSAVWCYRLLRMPPDYWVSNQQLLAVDNATLVELADTAERRLLSAVSAEGGIVTDESRVVHATFDELNAWLALKSDNWAAYFNVPAPPGATGTRMVAAAGDKLIFAFEIEHKGMPLVVSVLTDMHMLEDGRLFVRVDAVRAGRMPVPLSAFDWLGASGGEDDSREYLVKQMLEGQTLEPVADHPGDARLQLRMTALTVRPEGVDATLHAERR